MKWNLVGCVEAEQRIGYVWLEFARLTAQGLEHVTAGIGMKANRGGDGVQRWYFLLRGPRIGEDVALRRANYPLTRRELVDMLGDEDELLTTPSEYRRRLNEIVYGFPSVEQYETMISLLLELRRPHLSKALNARDVGKLLSASLPEVDHDLMRRLGEGIEQLDDLQEALRTLEAVRERVDQFNRNAYRAYAQAAVAERGERLRRADTAHGKASVQRRERAEQLGEARTRAHELEQALVDAIAQFERADGERDALRQSAAWAAIAEIEQLGRTAGHARVAAEQAHERGADASGRAAADEADTIAAAAVAEREHATLTKTLAMLAAEAGTVGFAARHEALASTLEEPARAESAAELLGEEAERWLLMLGEHQQLLDMLAESEAAYERERKERDESELTVRRLAEQRAELETRLEDANDALVEAIEAWAGELGELPLDQAAQERVLELACAAGVESSPSPQEVWRDVLEERRNVLLDERRRLLARGEQLAGERRELEAARELLAGEQDEPPPTPPTRLAVRDEREGAPLWQLVDFAPSLGAQERAGVEAALEAAGLLDAWVAPDGAVRDPDTLDVLLDAGAPRAVGATLADALSATGDNPVERSAIERVLAAVALVERPGEDLARHASAVSYGGHFRLGLAQGHFCKPAAEYIGASARAARRARRIAELDAALEAVAALENELGLTLAAIEKRLVALTVDVERFPDVEPLASARRKLVIAEQREQDARVTCAAREREVGAAAERRAHAQAVRIGHAESCGLPLDFDRVDIRAREGAAERYRAALPTAVQGAARSREAADWVVELARRAEETRAAIGDLVRAAEVAAGEARRLQAEYAERKSALGSTGEEIRARMQAVEARIKLLREERIRLTAADKDAGIVLKGLEGQLTDAVAALDAAARERETALDAFKRLEENDVFVLALEEDAPDDTTMAGEWTLTRALEVLRAIPPRRLEVRSSLVALANQVQQRCSDLDRSLGQLADMGVVAESDADGLVVVRVRQGARTLTIAGVTARLEDEIAERERALSAEQRRVFNDALLEEIAEHLRGRIERVNGLVVDMNATLVRCPTGSGKTVQLEWAPREDGEDDLRDVSRLLRRSVVTLGEVDRERLIAFFRERIQQARDHATIGSGGGGERGAAAHLRDAFDYRDWFAFTLHQLQGGQRIKLTAKQHAVGSGGEQAVLIHMPLFAAAAALYSSSRDGRAPRLVMLDEALSGIDEETREKVLGVLVALDLDVVMTSHELWGAYRSVPSLSIYQLHRENGLFGVACEHFLWDGESLRELEQATLLD
jgi:uncharacterized protein (TIGR02680 family)